MVPLEKYQQIVDNLNDAQENSNQLQSELLSLKTKYDELNKQLALSGENTPSTILKPKNSYINKNKKENLILDLNENQISQERSHLASDSRKDSKNKTIKTGRRDSSSAISGYMEESIKDVVVKIS